MQKVLTIYLPLAILFLFFSCKGVKKNEQVSKNIQPVKIENFPSLAPSHDDPYFTEVKTVNSINSPSSITRNMIQDRQGHIWFATWEGIIRYDGNTFVNFTNKEGLRRFRTFTCLLYTSPSPRDRTRSRMPSSA